MQGYIFRIQTLPARIDQRRAEQEKSEAGSDANLGTPTARNCPFTSSGNRQVGSTNHSSNQVTPHGSPQATVLPGTTVFIHLSPVPQKLPHPGAIFPHPTRPNQFTILCCRSAFDGRTCTIPTCAFNHFLNQLTQVPQDLRGKLKQWVTNHTLVLWHADATNWANPTGNVRTSTRSATTFPT